MASSSMSSSRLTPLSTSSARRRAARASSPREEYEMHRLSASRAPSCVSRSMRSTAVRAPGASRVRSPSTCTATPWSFSSATSRAMYSSSSCISAEISVTGRCQFSSEKANSVSTSTPASSAPSTASRTAFIPARWPSGRGRLRSRAQRPLPSMMTATWRGTAPFRRIWDSRSSAISDLHDLRFLGFHRLVHLSQMIVVQLLNVLLGVLLFILRDVLGLLDLADRIGACVADRHPPFLGELVHDLHQLPPPLFVERGERDADQVAVVGGGESQIGREDRFFDRLEEPLVPRLDGQELRLRCRHARDLIERHLAAVGVHAHQVQQRRRRLARAHGRELPLHRFHSLVHRVLRLLDVVRQERGGGGHWTIVPTRSPARTLAVAPGWLMLNTTMGSLFSLQRPKAFASITA